MSSPAQARPVGRILAIAGAIVAVAALAFGIGRFTAFDATTAPATPSTDSAEAGFARDMQVHHGQAVDMAMEIYRKTSDDELRTLSYDIATGQSAQRGEMYGWLVSWGLSQSGGPLMSWMQDSSAHQHDAQATDAQLRDEMGMATDAQLAQLRAATGTTADCQFLGLMIRHHEGAIPMAQAVIELGSDARVSAVAQSMIDTQSAEIDAMRSIQTRLACS
ncbi:DUF305 domain-containing protein [Microbacterium sp. NPDC091313]